MVVAITAEFDWNYGACIHSCGIIGYKSACNNIMSLVENFSINRDILAQWL